MKYNMPKEGFIYEPPKTTRKFTGIGIENTKIWQNIGSLLRTAHVFGADFMFTVGERYSRQRTDTSDASRHVPLFHFKDFKDLYTHMPAKCDLVGVEMDNRASPLEKFYWPDRSVILLGAEDIGLSSDARKMCRYLVQLPGPFSMNVSCVGSIVLYDRYIKGNIK